MPPDSGRKSDVVPEVDELGKYIVQGDGRQATLILPSLVGKVALCVTSPPYHNSISYEGHVTDPRADYRTRKELSYSDEYLPFLDEVWSACYAMLAPGGHLAINVGSVLLEGFHFPLPQDVMVRLFQAKEKWDFVQTIIWNKVTGGVRRAGSVIRYGLPGYWYPNIMSEHIIIVRKPGPSTYRRDVPSEWWQPIWDLAPVPPGQIPHPAPFPEDLPHRLTRMVTDPGDIVLDPFLGAGTTAKAAYDLGRVCSGIDIEPSYVQYSKERLRMPSLVRPRQLRISVELPEEFVPRPSRGRTRHGAGLRVRRS